MWETRADGERFITEKLEPAIEEPAAAAAERGDDSVPAEHQSWYELHDSIAGRLLNGGSVAGRAALGPAEEVNDQHDEQNDHQDPDDAVTHVASSFGSRGHTPCCPT